VRKKRADYILKLIGALKVELLKFKVFSLFLKYLANGACRGKRRPKRWSEITLYNFGSCEFFSKLTVIEKKFSRFTKFKSLIFFLKATFLEEILFSSTFDIRNTFCENIFQKLRATMKVITSQITILNAIHGNTVAHPLRATGGGRIFF
jgi:hypothetical protein